MLEQHTLVGRDSLMRRQIELADLDRKRRIEQMPVGQPFALDEHAQRVCVPGEVQPILLDRSGYRHGRRFYGCSCPHPIHHKRAP